MDDLVKKVGKLIKEKRLEKGYSTQELAEKLGVSAGLINNIENAKTDTFNISLMNGLCEILSISRLSMLVSEPSELKNILGSANDIPISLMQHINSIVDEYIKAGIKLNFNKNKLEVISKKVVSEIRFISDLYND